MTTYDVFLSYNGADRDTVVAIGARLSEEGLRPFVDRWHLVPGESYVPALEKALEVSSTVAVFFGPQGMSAWQEEEKQLALDLVNRARERRCRVIPVILPGGRLEDIDGFIRLRTSVDLAEEDGFDRLVAGIEGRAPGGPPSDRPVEAPSSTASGPRPPGSAPSSTARPISNGPTNEPRRRRGSSQTTDNRGATVTQQIVVHGNAMFGPMNVGNPGQGESNQPGAAAEGAQPPHTETPLGDAYARREALLIKGEDISAIDIEILALRRALRHGPTLHADEYLGDGRFRLIEVIGRGGFALVWKAYDNKERKLVAVKVLHGELAREPSRRERLFRGAKRMAALRHPNVVRVLVPEGEEEGFHYFVMELVPGGDLHEAIVRGKVDRDRGLALVESIADALAVAHAAGLVHRDVKPENILLRDDTTAVLTDFDLVQANDTMRSWRTPPSGRSTRWSW